MTPHRSRQSLCRGLPSGIQNSVISIANVIVQSNINSFGAQAMAGCGAYSKVEGFAFLPVTCFFDGAGNLRQPECRCRSARPCAQGMKFGTLCSVLMAEIVGVGIYTLSPWLIGAFSREPDVIAFGVQQAHTAALFYCLLAFSHCCAGILRGLGRPVVPMMVMLMIWCALRITYITITLHFIRAISVVFWAYPLTWSISSVLFAWYILHCPDPTAGRRCPPQSRHKKYPRIRMGHTDTGTFIFLITKHGSGAVSAQFANSQTSTVYFVSGRLRKNASATCFRHRL